MSFPITLGTGALRTYNNAASLIESIKNQDAKEGAYYLFQTMVSTACLAGTLFAHPLGMTLTAANDLLIELTHLGQHLNNGDYTKALESCAKIANDSLYLACLLDGGVKLTIASLAMQIALGVYNAQKEWSTGHWLEAAGHMGMAMARCTQLHSQVKLLQHEMHIQAQKELVQKINKTRSLKKSEGETNSSPAEAQAHVRAGTVKKSEPIEARINKYENNLKGWPALHCAIDALDEEAALRILETKPSQAKLFTPSIPLTFYQGLSDYEDNLNRSEIYLGVDEKGYSSLELAVKNNCSAQLVNRLIDAGSPLKITRREYPGQIKTGIFYGYSSRYAVPMQGTFKHTELRDAEYTSYTPFYWAIVNKNEELISLLLAKGCKLEDRIYSNVRFNGVRHYTAQEMLGNKSASNEPASGNTTLIPNKPITMASLFPGSEKWHSQPSEPPRYRPQYDQPYQGVTAVVNRPQSEY